MKRKCDWISNRLTANPAVWLYRCTNHFGARVTYVSLPFIAIALFYFALIAPQQSTGVPDTFSFFDDYANSIAFVYLLPSSFIFGGYYFDYSLTSMNIYNDQNTFFSLPEIINSREISLSEKENVSNGTIVARYYDFANVYYVIKIRINRHCTCCNTDTILLTTAYFPVPRVAYRIREYFDGQDPKIIDSGFYETGFSPARLV